MRQLIREQKVAVETIIEAIRPIQGLKVVIGNPNIDVVDTETDKLVKRYWLRDTYFETLVRNNTRKYKYTDFINGRRVSAIRKQIEESYKEFKTMLHKEQEENKRKEKIRKAIEIMQDKNSKVRYFEINSPDDFTLYISGVGYTRFIVSDDKLKVSNITYVDAQDLELVVDIIRELEKLIFNEKESLALAV